ncbi:FkbM family methyltransferase [Nocardia colli]|uniref:FkbM family methyltransferase n=1 Tax=Nocardia colli TaxID=2545717 RepID=UPI0035E066F8
MKDSEPFQFRLPNELAAGLAECHLPDGLTVCCVNPAEAAALHHEIFVERSWLAGDLSLDDGDTVVDVGANIGLSTLFFHRERTDIRLLSFEPARLPFAALTINVARNGVNAVCRPVALGAAAGLADFTYYPTVTAMSGLHADPKEDADITRLYMENCGFTPEDIAALVPERYLAETVTVEVSTLSEELRRAGVDRVDLLKIDVEKSELQVLDGLDRTSWDRVRRVAIEVHDSEGSLDGICDRLFTFGFRVHVDQEPLHRNLGLYTVTGVRE